jgi:acyl carrier protein
MDTSDVYRFLTEVFRVVFLRDDIVLRPDLTAGDVPGWDSFKQIEIILAAEQHFGVKLSTRELDGLNQLGDLVELIAAKAKTG